MLTPDELSGFLAGELGEAFELSYLNAEKTLLFVRTCDGCVVTNIPSKRGQESDLFRIEAALSDPICGAEYKMEDFEYVVQMKTRAQVRSVAKIALNHLGWGDDSLLRVRFIQTGN